MLTFLFSVMTLLLEGRDKLVSSHRVLHHSDGDNPIHQHHHRHHHRGLKVDGITNNGNDEASPIHGGLCGTIDMPEKEMELVQRNMDLYLKTVPDASRIFQTSVTIDVSFHVIYNGATGAGFVSDSRITDQIQALNDAFESHGFQFNLRDITKTNNRQWYTNCRTNFDFKRALRDPNDGLDVMYFYTCLPIDADGDEILGYATFPFANPPAVSIDGVVCDGDTLPRGPLLSYDEGKVAVHEVGHWLGLYHTFQGSCSGGDFIADTPAEAEPAFGCPFGRDTCSSPGVDPINNYMDYTDDYCSTEFSPGQTARMQALWNIYRSAAPKPPTIVLSDGVPLTGQNLVTGASQEYELRNVAIDSLVLIELSGDNGNADLYTGTCSSTETDSNESCTNVAKVDNDSIQATVFATTDVMELTITATVTPPPLPIELQLDAAVAGQSAATDTLQRYFVTDVAAGTALVISLSGLSGDADLYVGIGYLPTIDTSDCASQGATSSELCILVVTEPSTVNILVSAFRGYTGLTVLAREDVATELQFGVALNGQNAATETELRFYVANVDAGSTLTIDVAGPNGDADLYIGFDYGPTTTVYDCASESSNSFETCSFTVAEMSTVNILVYAFTGYTGLTVLATTDGLPVAPDSSPTSQAPVPAFSSDAPVTAQSSEAPTSAPSSDKEDECGLFGNSIFCPLLFRGVFARFFRNFLDLF